MVLRVLIEAQSQRNRSFQIDQLKISTKITIIILLLLLLLLFYYYYYYFYNKSVPLFITRANTNNVDRLLFFYSSRRAYFNAHFLRGVINNSL